MRIPILLALCMSLAPAAVAAQADMAARLAACSACHGEHGEGKTGNEYYPHLAGKPAGYLHAQLLAFRDGTRSYPQMNWLMRNLGEAYLQRIAAYYAALPPRSSAQVVAMAPDAAARARVLTEQGDEARGIPACASCHGADLAGLEPGVPALIGLPPDYIVAQLGAWRTGARTARAPDCMAAVAKALEPTDLRKLGDYLASQGADHATRPAPQGSFALPVACGSMPAADTPPAPAGEPATRDGSPREATP